MRVTDRGRQQTLRNEPERYETRGRSGVCHNVDTPLAIPNPAFLISEVQSALTFIVMHDAWRLHPLTWIHRSEARRIARELRHAGHAVQRATYRRSAIADPGPVRCILRLSDPDAAPLIGPGSAFETSLSAGGLARSEQLKHPFSMRHQRSIAGSPRP